MGAILYASLHTRDLGPDLHNEIAKSDTKLVFVNRLVRYLGALAGGLKVGHLRVEMETGGTGTRASQTVTLTQGNISNGDTLVIGGVTLTVAAAPANESEWLKSAVD